MILCIKTVYYKAIRLISKKNIFLDMTLFEQKDLERKLTDAKRLEVVKRTENYMYISFPEVEGNRSNLYPETMSEGHIDRLNNSPHTFKEYRKMYGFWGGLKVYFTGKE